MRARIVPPYPSFTYVMSQIGDCHDESQAGSWGHDDMPSTPVPRPYSKYDDNPFMVDAPVWFSDARKRLNGLQRTVRCNHSESAHGGVSMVSVSVCGNVDLRR